MKLSRNVLAVFLAMIFCSVQIGQAEETTEKITFDEHVQPIFREKCVSCHNPDMKKGDLDLSNYTGVMQGGSSGDSIEAGDASNSYLFMLITHESEPFMPLEAPKMPDEMIATVGKWIDGGVLENSGSRAKLKKKMNLDLALAGPSTERPEVPPLPPRLSLEPITFSISTTAVSALATNPWSPLVAVAGHQQILLYHTKTLDLLGTLAFPEGVPQVLKFSRNGSLLLAGGGRSAAQGKVVIWDVKTGERIFDVGDELDTVLAADISSDHTLVALGGPQRVVRVYSIETGQLLYELRKHTDWINTLEFSPDSVLLATGDRNGGLIVWEGWTDREYLTLKGHGAAITDVSWRSDSNVLASCSEDGSIRLWEMENGGQIRNWGAHGGVAAVEFTRDGRIFSAGRDRRARLWGQDGKQIREFEEFSDLALEATFCDESNVAIAGDWSGVIRLWNTEDGARVGELSSNPPRLADRLLIAEQELAEKQNDHEPLAAAKTAAQTAWEQIGQQYAEAQKTSLSAKDRLGKAMSALESAKTALTKASQQIETINGVVTSLELSVPALSETFARLQEASQQLPEDKELAELATRIKTVFETRARELETKRQEATVVAKVLEAAQQQSSTAGKESQDANTANNTAKTIVDQLAAKAKAAEENLTVAKQAFEPSAAAVAAAKEIFEHWKSSIEFAQKLAQLQQKRRESLDQLEKRQIQHAELMAVVDKAQKSLAQAGSRVMAAEAELATTQKTAAEAAADVDAAKAVEVEVTQVRDGALGKVDILSKVIVPLAEAAAKALEAAKTNAGDEQLAKAANDLKSLAEAKVADLENARQGVEASSVELETAKTGIREAQEQHDAALGAVEESRKKVAELRPAVTMAEEAIVVSQEAVLPAEAAILAAQKEVDRFNNEIAIAKGLVPKNTDQAAATP